MRSRKKKTNSRKGRPSPAVSATKFPVGTRKKGGDRNIWTVAKNKAGVKLWVKQKDTKEVVDKVIKKLYSKLYKWWFKLSTGSSLIIKKDGTYKMFTSSRKTRNAQIKHTKEYIAIQEDNPDVKYIVWSAMSVDALIHFIYYVLNRGTQPQIKNLCGKNSLKEVVDNPNVYLQKYVIDTNKDYTLKYARTVNYKKVWKKVNKLKC